MAVRIRANPLFDGVWVLPAGVTQVKAIITGEVARFLTSVAGRDAFDLPDSSLLFPGDVVHYYFEATGTARRNGGHA